MPSYVCFALRRAGLVKTGNLPRSSLPLVQRTSQRQFVLSNPRARLSVAISHRGGNWKNVVYHPWELQLPVVKRATSEKAGLRDERSIGY
jgi:hypothetical protein